MEQKWDKTRKKYGKINMEILAIGIRIIRIRGKFGYA